jgi:hypothetical protein
MVYILPLQNLGKRVGNVSSEINTAIVTNLGTVNTGSILLTSLRAAIL